MVTFSSGLFYSRIFSQLFRRSLSVRFLSKNERGKGRQKTIPKREKDEDNEHEFIGQIKPKKEFDGGRWGKMARKYGPKFVIYWTSLWVTQH